ncbi:MULTISPECIES: sulfur oxidation c-type cytochrome SoxX [unclassified Bosea (in: a-proteobacteria)]|uniref:sulfur oxidation c-type cytochrome SoxX n=1 Tax=unclassified Bosea (in: a-proteobacteria) TaxID=2653178 RepID=UPI001F015EE2|nr:MULTISPECIES: sulfur oxidation c-type cytochrome SoxX [unclassified Bosea (in: a-proteobacteria)]
MRLAAIRIALIVLALASAPAGALEAYTVVGDAIPAPLGGKVGDLKRGRALVLDRAQGNCLICHQVPEPNEPFQGTIGPGLAGVATRLDSGQLRLRLIDAGLLNPQTVMPPYFRTEGLRDVAPAFRDRPALTAQEIEDVVAYLASLRTP